MRLIFYKALIALFVAIGFAFSADAQAMIIRLKSGAEDSQALSTMRKFTFVDNNLQLLKTDGTTEMYAISGIEELHFDSLPLATNSLLSATSSSNLSVFPNPVDNILYFKNISVANITFKVYRLDGSAISGLAFDASSASVDVSPLKQGFYLVKINNQVLKFMKL